MAQVKFLTLSGLSVFKDNIMSIIEDNELVTSTALVDLHNLINEHNHDDDYAALEHTHDIKSDNLEGTLEAILESLNLRIQANTEAIAGCAPLSHGNHVPGIKSALTVSDLGWSTNSDYVPDLSMLAYWNGAYSGTSSNLTYCNKGAFGDAAIKGVDTTAKNGSVNLLTSGGVYSGLAGKVNVTTAGGSYNWFNVQQFNASDTTPSYLNPTCAFINVISYSGWQPWIRAVDSNKGTWALGQYEDKVHLVHFNKSNTGNSPTKNFYFGSDGYLYTPDGFKKTDGTEVSYDGHVHSNATQSDAGFMSASDKTKLDGIATGAEANVQSDWNATSGDAFIKNKPSIPEPVFVRGDGENSIVLDNAGSTATYDGSASLGWGTKTYCLGHIALGCYNSGSSNSILSIGNGTSESDRSDIISLTNNTVGNADLKGYYLNLNDSLTLDLSHGDAESHPISTYFKPGYTAISSGTSIGSATGSLHSKSGTVSSSYSTTISSFYIYMSSTTTYKSYTIAPRATATFTATITPNTCSWSGNRNGSSTGLTYVYSATNIGSCTLELRSSTSTGSGNLLAQQTMAHPTYTTYTNVPLRTQSGNGTTSNPYNRTATITYTNNSDSSKTVYLMIYVSLGSITQIKYSSSEYINNGTINLAWTATSSATQSRSATSATYPYSNTCIRMSKNSLCHLKGGNGVISGSDGVLLKFGSYCLRLASDGIRYSTNEGKTFSSLTD